jgi:hypothetical protein
MRSNQNPSGSVTRTVGDRSLGSDQRSMVAKLSMPQMPVEWLDSGSWRLPSGKALAEFALQAGFLAPLLFRADGFRKGAPKTGVSGASETGESSGLSRNGAQARGRQFGKGDSR